jgi:type IV secretory pathway VirB2 component (pilin)
MRNYLRRVGGRVGARRLVQIAIGLVVIEIVLTGVALITGRMGWLIL